MSSHFPLSYRWFLSKGLCDWEPWYFVDTKESVQTTPDFAKHALFTQQFKLETAADFDAYLFARRQDREDFAFFVVRNGLIEDRVVTIHLSFAKRFELKAPLRYGDINHSFIAWIRDIVVGDLEDWMTEEDL